MINVGGVFSAIPGRRFGSAGSGWPFLVKKSTEIQRVVLPRWNAAVPTFCFRWCFSFFPAGTRPGRSGAVQSLEFHLTSINSPKLQGSQESVSVPFTTLSFRKFSPISKKKSVERTFGANQPTIWTLLQGPTSYESRSLPMSGVRQNTGIASFCNKIPFG